ncbi:hypothetical protein BC941DRAFT_437265 [Chlamydoabsidia padenii]|nr:hypothetical protein BC941DRAFT_437265 [Chlamydoabsidia padenii]
MTLSPIDIPTLFQQSNTATMQSLPAPVLPMIPHNSRSFTMDTMIQYRLKVKLTRTFRLVLPHLVREQLEQLQLTCQTMDSLVRHYIWYRPSFHRHPTYDPLTVFQRFLTHLPHLRPITQETIQELCLSPMEEFLYDRVPKHFFTTLTQYIPNLRSLNLSRSTFFSSLPQHPWRWQHLTSLDLSFVEHLSDPLLVQLAVFLPSLCLIRLDGTRVNHGVGQLAHHCDHLSSLSLKKITTLSDEALVALAKFRSIHVAELDISECRQVSSLGLEVVARYCVHLSWLGMAHTPVSLATLRRWDHRFWKYLDIAYCTRLHEDILLHHQQQQPEDRMDKYYGDILAASSSTQVTKSPPSLYNLIIRAPQLEHLSLSMPVIQHLLTVHSQQPTNKLIDVDGDFNTGPSVSKVNRLTIHELPEHTPLSTLDDLITLFPKLQHLKLVRGYYETDYMHLSFSPGDDDKSNNTITEETITTYQPISTLVSVVLEQQRDLLEGPSMW